MSGICGIIRLDGAAVSKGDIERQTKRMAHLGPDRVAIWCEGAAGLAHLMMRITREDALDAQPLHDGDISLVADVRLDNREELAGTLAIDDTTLAVTPDSALILAAWKRWGADCVDRLLGDFAFAVWDDAQKTLTLVRDHMGQRHVFYHQGQDLQGNRFFAFASEIKGLWALPDVPRQLREDALARPAPYAGPPEPGETGYEGIRSIPGATVLTLAADGAITSRRYWEPHADPAHEGRDETYYIETYRKIVTEAVQCRVRRAVYPAGLFMGGGFDSSAICALAGPALAPGGKFIAVCSVMPEDYRGSIQHARKWVEMCRRAMPHLDVRYVTREGLDIFTDMERAFYTNDAGHSPNGYVTRKMMQEIAAAGGRILMDGFGGDYTVNPRGQKALLRLLRTGQLRRFAAEFRAMRKHLRQSTKQTLVRNVLWQMIPQAWLQLRTRYRHGLALFGPTFPIAQEAIERWKAKKGGRLRPWRAADPRAAMTQTCRGQQNGAAQGYSVNGAAFGLEFTQPFHDKRVVEFGLAIPEDLWLKDGKTRWLARTALKDVYPPEYQDRPPGNDDMGPDFLMMAKRIEPRVLAEIDRMEKAGHLSRYYDFPRMRKMLTRRSIDQHASGNEFDTRQAMAAFLHARYIEWFRGGNA
jgi:asparagine synthase (glutamine-hydrolysing)